MSNCETILNELREQAEKNLTSFNIADKAALEKLEYICRCITNRAPVRLLMSCLLAKSDRPELDPRKPYTEIGTDDSFSGRTYDEQYLTEFITKNRLPCNSTTAFLTPALRNINRPLTPDIDIIGRPRDVYKNTLEILEMVYNGLIDCRSLFADVIRFLLIIRNENEVRIKTLLAGLRASREPTHLSSEAIVKLIQQHLSCKNVSRLPVLIVAAALKSAEDRLGEQVRSLQPHTAADKQTGSLGDVEITLENEDNVVTCYEMKLKSVTINDINIALKKFQNAPQTDNYIFITTEPVEDEVRNYADKTYDESGTEIAILDCIGFLRHFLHLFHRIRMDFLNEYQNLVLNEPNSAVSQSLKEAFLALRRALEES
ncbi:MAG: DNA methyltransferase [Desulfobacteraceae bacterium]|nr:DNA methyltransferase [Desulfobacteraceae bacterium]